MVIIRIYHIPKGYTDITCDAVDVIPSKEQCVIHGGPNDGMIFTNSSGARVIRDTAGIQDSLFDE